MNEINSITNLLYQQTPDWIKNVIKNETLVNWLNIEAEEIRRYIKSDEKAKNNYEWAQIINSHPNDFKFKWLQLTNDKQILTSIRFLGCDKADVFVEIVLKNFEIIHKNELVEIAAIINEEYKIFNPLRFRFFSKNLFSTQKCDELNVTGDVKLVAELHKSINNCKFSYNCNNLNLIKTKKINWYNQYNSEYEFLFEQQPHLKLVMQQETEESLQDLVNKNLCFELYYNNELAGIIAFDVMNNLHLKGYCVIEEIIFAKYRGKGLGKYLQLNSIKNLQLANEAPFIFGQIGFTNIASLKTAYSVNRKDAGTFYFYNL